MIATCDECGRHICELFDGDLLSRDRQSLEAHLGTCGECRSLFLGMVEDQKSMAITFEDEKAEAPFPQQMEKEFGYPAGPRTFDRILMIALAASVLLTIGVFFAMQEETEAEMGDVLAAVSGRYEHLDDVEYRIAVSLPAVELLQRMFDKNKEKKGPLLPVYRVIAKPDRLVIRPEATDPSLKVFGFDGEQAWIWKPEGREVEVFPKHTLDSHLRTQMAGGKKGLGQLLGVGNAGGLAKDWNILEFLSWKTLFDMHRNDTWTEVTNTLHKKAKLRAFHIHRAARPENGESEYSSVDVDLVVDPVEATIQLLNIDFKLAEISIVSMKAELVRTDQGTRDEIFSFKAYAPRDVVPTLGVLKAK